MKKVYKAFLACLMTFGICSNYNVSAAEAETTIAINTDGKYIVGENTEFTVGMSTTDTANTMVKAYFDVDKTNVETIEYYETAGALAGQWVELTTDYFGPKTGFPLMNGAVSKFRVTFKSAGTTDVKVELKKMADSEVVASATKTFTSADAITSSLLTDFVVGSEKEFTVTSNANLHKNEIVIANIAYDKDAVTSIQYFETQSNEWMELQTDYFGPVSGFPLTDGATSKFKVNFKKAGTVPVKISMKNVSTQEVVAEKTLNFTVTEAEAPVIPDNKIESEDSSVVVTGPIVSGATLEVVEKDKDETKAIIENIKDQVYVSKVNFEKIFDLSLMKDGVTIQPNGTIKVKIKLEDGLLGKGLDIVYIGDDGSVVSMNAIVEDGYIIFETDHFSTYAIVSAKSNDTTETPEEDDNTTKNDAPNTGDASNVMYLFTTMAASGAGLLELRRRKNKK